MEDTFRTKVRIPRGIDISEPENPGSEVEKCACADASASGTAQSSWCYLFIHHNKVDAFTKRLNRDKIHIFLHKTVIYQRRKHSRGIRSVEKPTVSGLVFLQGTSSDLQYYLDVNFPGHHLVNDCSTHLPAVIPDSVMQPFMHVTEASPERIRFLLHPFRYYAGGNVRLRLTSGFLAGVEGYVVRIDRDRRLVMDVGGMSVAISGIHCEKFEVVAEDTEKYRQAKNGGGNDIATTPPARNLTGLQERIDRELYVPANPQEVSLITEVLDLWRERAAVYLEKRQVAEAMEILIFLLEEIDYHYSSLLSSKTLDMAPVLSVARLIAGMIDRMTVNPKLTEGTRCEISEARQLPAALRISVYMRIHKLQTAQIPVFTHRVETRTRLLRIQVMMSHDQSLRITPMQFTEQPLPVVFSQYFRPQESHNDTRIPPIQAISVNGRCPPF